ncbi:MAG: DUF6247 family protein [Pseudonocardiaceae bacterium]
MSPPPSTLSGRSCWTRRSRPRTSLRCHDLLHKWRHFAYAELKNPGTYFRMLATAAHTLATGKAPEGSIAGEEMRALICQRLGR